MRIIILFILVSFAFQINAQSNRVYIFEDRYEQPTSSLVNAHDIEFNQIKILGQYMIDPSRKSSIDYGLVGRYLNKLYPNRRSYGVLCINLEGSLFNVMRDNDCNNANTVHAINQYISLVKFVKARRPNLQVGIYGLPYTVYYESQV